jgi:hypothetical protein
LKREEQTPIDGSSLDEAENGVFFEENATRFRPATLVNDEPSAIGVSLQFKTISNFIWYTTITHTT